MIIANKKNQKKVHPNIDGYAPFLFAKLIYFLKGNNKRVCFLYSAQPSLRD